MNRYTLGIMAAVTLGLTACAGTSSTIPKGEPLPPTQAPAAVPLAAETEKPVRGQCPSLARCASTLHDVVVSHWRMPPLPPKARPATTVLVDVKADGYIRSMKVTRSSGITAYDNSAIAAIQQSQPFVELRGLAEVKDGTQLQFVFVPR